MNHPSFLNETVEMFDAQNSLKKKNCFCQCHKGLFLFGAIGCQVQQKNCGGFVMTKRM